MAPPRMPSAMTNGNHDRKKVLITRLFPVTIPPDEEAFVLTPGRFSDDVAGYPFPADDDLQLKKKKPQVKQKRTPMYAVALVITLPPQAPLHSTHGTSRSAFRGSSSFTEQNSFPSSLTSLKWGQPGTLGHQAYGMIDWLSTPDDDDRMESLTQHWDVIMRTLTRLQSVVSSTLFTMLKQADLASPDPFPGSMNSVSAQLARSCSAAARQPRDGLAVKPPKTNAKIITLFPNCLHEHRKVILEVDAGRNRIPSLFEHMGQRPELTHPFYQRAGAHVNIPFSDYLASYETAVSSPSSSGYLSTPGFSTMFDAFEQSCRVAVDGDSPLNVAGWLPSFHPDFVLQAVPPGQKSLIEEVKNAMRNEPFSAATHRGGYDDSDDDDDRWVDVSDAIIADTTNFTVRRIRYRRFVRLRPANPPVDQSKPESPQLPHPTESPLVTPSTQSLEARMEENFIEESIVALEQVFTDAVERVLAVGSSTGGSSTGVGTGVDSDQPENGSAGSSRSASKRRGRRQSETIAPEELVPLDDAQSHQDNQDKQQQQHHGSQAATKGRALAATARGTSEVPRSECKTVILSALEEVVRQVLDEHDPLAAGEQGADATRSGSDGNERGSVLRQAVRSWLTKVAAAE
ncbi:hypothetical protein P8C59_000785 [Phyllachora maydis]|uniref:Uncharacterized protein n=1 Tax=Phyllachora maydis TaxID=1825666 RepID=A0AAD9HXZ5_9PEZI|nr:hypothetical protein P8C59_000785 [Phyllachora maydis]